MGHGNSVNNYNDVGYVGDLRDCTKCHLAGTYDLPLPDGLIDQPTPRDWLKTQGPATAACLSCHTTKAAAAHAATMTSSTLGEACDACHGPNARSLGRQGTRPLVNDDRCLGASVSRQSRRAKLSGITRSNPSREITRQETLRRDLPALTGLRFFLALWVILHHLTGPGQKLEATALLLPHGLFTLIRGGYQAVTTFFVLSGFVLTRSYAATVWTRAATLRYALGRVARVYPVYLLSLAVVAPFILADQTPGKAGYLAAHLPAGAGLARRHPGELEHAGLVAFLRDVLLRDVPVRRAVHPPRQLAQRRAGRRHRRAA